MSDNIYLNVVFSNPQPDYGADPQRGTGAYPAEYSANKTIPIIEKCNDYYCSVTRFDIPLDEVPLYIVPVVPNQPNPNKTIYIIGVIYGGVHYPINVEYIPDNIYPAPAQNKSIQVITSYYYCFSFQTLLECINASLLNVLTTSGYLATLPVGTKSPFFWYNSATNLFMLTVPQQMSTDPIQIFVNEPLQNLFSSFHFIDRSPTEISTDSNQYGADYYLILDGTNLNQYITFTGVVGTYIQYAQEYVTSIQWVSLRKILVTSNTIPISKEVVPVINADGSQSDITSSIPIITDFLPQIEIAPDTRSIAYYMPRAQYRLIDLNGTTALNRIDLKVFWEDRLGNIYPLLISCAQQGSLKLAFLKKSLYNNNAIDWVK